MAARGLRGSGAGVRGGRPSSPGSRRSPATTACSSSPRSGSSSRGIAGAHGAPVAPDGARDAPRDLVRRGRRRASPSSSSSWRRGGRASSRSSARSRRRARRARSCSSATSASGTASRSPASLDHLLGMGIGPAHRDADRRRDRGGDDLRHARAAASSSARSLVIGAWARRRSTDFGPFFVYAALLFAFSALVSAVHVPGGTFIHSAVALAPYSYILALEGIVIAIGWVAARRSAWDVDTAVRVFGGATLVFAVVVAIVGLARRSMPSGRRDATTSVAVARGARCRGRPGERPGHVDRRLRHPLLDRARRRRPGQRSARHDPRRRARPTTSAGSSSTAATRSPPSRRSSTARSARPGSAQPILAEGSRRPGSPSTRCWRTP